jgi:hypothetical protein
MTETTGAALRELMDSLPPLGMGSWSTKRSMSAWNRR